MSDVMVGRRVKMLWSGDGPDTWYCGRVVQYAAPLDRHLVKYDDGESKWHDLSAEQAAGQLVWLQEGAESNGTKHVARKPSTGKRRIEVVAPTLEGKKHGARQPPKGKLRVEAAVEAKTGVKSTTAPGAPQQPMLPTASRTAPTVQEPTWVQCDRCDKWRLVAGSPIDEDAPWFCELNADPSANTCEAAQLSRADEDGTSYYVERILAERRRRGRTEYLIRWLGWSDEHDSWEAERHVEASLIEEFRMGAPRRVTTTSDIVFATWAFVAQCPDPACGRGLFARCGLKRGQAICEYFGPLISTEQLRPHNGQYVLRIPRTAYLIDGNCDSCPCAQSSPCEVLGGPTRVLLRARTAQPS
jgi:hypothetical protein